MIWFAKLMKFISQIIIQFRVKFPFGCTLLTKRQLKRPESESIDWPKTAKLFVFVRSNLTKKRTESIDGKIQFLVSTIMQTLNRYAPEKKLVITKNRCPWANTDIKNLLKKRDQARKKKFRLIKQKIERNMFLREMKEQANLENQGEHVFRGWRSKN